MHKWSIFNTQYLNCECEDVKDCHLGIQGEQEWVAAENGRHVDVFLYHEIIRIVWNFSKKQKQKFKTIQERIDCSSEILQHCAYCTACCYLHFRKSPPKSDVFDWMYMMTDFLYIKGAQWDFVGLSSFVCLWKIYPLQKNRPHTHRKTYFHSLMYKKRCGIRGHWWSDSFRTSSRALVTARGICQYLFSNYRLSGSENTFESQC